jgi:hypothetical protein
MGDSMPVKHDSKKQARVKAPGQTLQLLYSPVRNRRNDGGGVRHQVPKGPMTPGEALASVGVFDARSS